MPATGQQFYDVHVFSPWTHSRSLPIELHAPPLIITDRVLFRRGIYELIILCVHVSVRQVFACEREPSCVSVL